ncbi:MAG: hypothetical protein MUC69_04370 [Gemmatimonadales bacterium]|jgi:hypothetical protein|nr:hypothetical protein [Gemmatimonadales bacterium]
MSVLLPLLALGALARGEIFGDLRLGDKFVADAKLTLKCGAETVEGTTDKTGSFRLATKASGKCTLTVAYDKQAPSVDVVLFDQPARYRFVLEQADGKYVLKRV